MHRKCTFTLFVSETSVPAFRSASLAYRTSAGQGTNELLLTFISTFLLVAVQW